MSASLKTADLSPTLYDALDVDRKASSQQIEDGYHDKCDGLQTLLDEKLITPVQFDQYHALIDDAHGVLADLKRKQQYDDVLDYRDEAASKGISIPGFSTYRTMADVRADITKGSQHLTDMVSAGQEYFSAQVVRGIDALGAKTLGTKLSSFTNC